MFHTRTKRRTRRGPHRARPIQSARTSRILDTLKGRNAKDLRSWIAGMPAGRLSEVQGVSVDPHEGHRSAVANPDPAHRPLLAFGPTRPSSSIPSAWPASPTCRAPAAVNTSSKRRSSSAAGRETRSMTSASVGPRRRRVDDTGWDRLRMVVAAVSSTRRSTTGHMSDTLYRSRLLDLVARHGARSATPNGQCRVRGRRERQTCQRPRGSRRQGSLRPAGPPTWMMH
jgi:hypothetical protein